MKILALAAFLIPSFVAELFARHDAQGSIGHVGILLAYLVAAILTAAVLGWTWVRLDADARRRA